MWRKNKHQGLVMLALLSCCQASLAATTTLSSPYTISKTPTLTTTPTLTLNLKPEITGYKIGQCIHPGDTLAILGKNFGTQKGVSLGGHGINVPLSIRSWSNTLITAVIPRDSRIQAGQWYYTGIRDLKTGNWLSNIDKNLTICQASTTTTTTTIKPTLSATPLPTITQPTATEPAPARPAPGSAPSNQETTGASNDAYNSYYDLPADSGAQGNGGWEDYGGYGQEPSTSRVLPNSNGSLMDSQLPPPPPNLRLRQQREAYVRRHNEPNELLVVSSSMNEARQLAQQLAGYNLHPKRRKILKNLGLVMTVFRVPADTDLQQITTDVRKAYPKMWVDMNTRYQLMGSRNTASALQQIHWQRGAASCGRGLRIGMIDTRINTRHPALQSRHINQHQVISHGIKQARPDHGTAVATLLVGDPASRQFGGLLPAAHLYAVDVFRQRDSQHVDTTAEWLVNAIDWLLSQKVQAINMSLGGPRNLLVDVALQRSIKAGVAVIAAAGNAGPRSVPVYPAAQPGVIAVTAVDASDRIYSQASQGSYIDFAAPGADIWSANGGHGGKYVSGTSFAAPFITAGMVRLASREGLRQAYTTLQHNARDLGQPGKDPVFGWGLIQLPGECH